MATSAVRAGARAIAVKLDIELFAPAETLPLNANSDVGGF
jgi:hypothetical protein